MKINKNIIKELSDYLDEFNLTEIEYTAKDLKVNSGASCKLPYLTMVMFFLAFFMIFRKIKNKK